jgi:hypothetical protein
VICQINKKSAMLMALFLNQTAEIIYFSKVIFFTLVKLLPLLAAASIL